MIKYNSKTLSDWNFGSSNVIKVYRNGAVVFYKVSGSSGSTPTFNVCYAVVDDITQYQSTEFVDIFDKATQKWYKLNNLNQYEEYGVYGSGRDITYYEGKLTVDDGYEYEYSYETGWANRGALTGTSKIIKSPEYIERTSTYDGYCSLLEYLTEDTKFIIKHKQTNGGGGRVIGDYVATDSDDWRFFFVSSTLYYDFLTQRKSTSKSMPMSAAEEWEVGNYYIKNTASGVNLITGTPQTFSSRPDHLYIYHSGGVGNAGETADDYGQIWYIKIYKNNVLVRDFIPWTDMNGNYGLYDKVNDETVQTTGQMTASTTINDVEVGNIEYPLHYQEKQDPLNNLLFESLDAAKEYAYNNCVYDGMRATIGGNKYYFDSEDENGWVKVQSWYKVEDVTKDGVGWTVTNSDTYNPDKDYYDDFSISPNSLGYKSQVAKVTIYGYEHFTYYIRSNSISYENSNAEATNIDELQSDPTSISSNESITNTRSFNRAPKSEVNLDNYRRITYNNLDKTVEHTFYVSFYKSSFNESNNATILIPKEQDNENWEQVTFSASSNVASSDKYLYIDGEYSKNGGTKYFYSRWIVGLPSGSHTSNTSLSNYNYCPNVTSSTFTSVAGEQRQVNFTYDNTVNKSLSFRLVDENGNVLTPSDTVYYRLNIYNSCGLAGNQDVKNFPRSEYVKVGGTFSFTNTDSRHYIYGYRPPTLGTTYYADDYQDTFDIVYTKLAVEAVTITYTTYDPNDSEIPAFNTDITYPYSGGTTSSTTLTSYDVPNGYGYVVSCTSNKFSADSKSFTANYTENPISFVLYPNNREFATVDEMSAYAYAWEGMKATVGAIKYKYENGAWVEVAEEFTVNLNSQWQTSTSYGNISDTGNYDFYESFSNHTVAGGKATMFITINGYQTFTFKVRNYSENCCDYVVVNNIDDISSNGKVYYSNVNKSSNTTWYDVTFDNLDGGEHVITITYKKDGSVNSGSDRGYVAIPKTQ